MSLFDKIADFAEQVAAEWLVDHRRQLPVTWVMFDAEGEGEVVITPWASELEKQVAMAAIRKRLADPKVAAYAMIAEMWIADRSIDEADINAEGDVRLRPGQKWVSPRDDPKRREGVICYASTRHEKQQWLWQQVRDYKGMVRLLRPLPEFTYREPLAGTHLKGVMPNLFKEVAQRR